MPSSLPPPLLLSGLKGVGNEKVYKSHSKNLAGYQSNSTVDHLRGREGGGGGCEW